MYAFLSNGIHFVPSIVGIVSLVRFSFVLLFLCCSLYRELRSLFCHRLHLSTTIRAFVRVTCNQRLPRCRCRLTVDVCGARITVCFDRFRGDTFAVNSVFVVYLHEIPYTYVRNGRKKFKLITHVNDGNERRSHTVWSVRIFFLSVFSAT